MESVSLILTTCVVIWAILLPATTTDAAEYEHEEDVVYGYKDGMAPVMDVYTPQGQRNNAGVIVVMAGGMRSSPVGSHHLGSRASAQSLLEAGYVLFATAHSSQPKYAVDEIAKDIPRAVRFVRHNAERFGIDPQRIGIKGGSSGGQMALLAATAPPAADPEADDPVDRQSSRVQAVVAHFPGTDNLNFGNPNTTILEHFRSQGYNVDAAFDFHQWDDQAKRFERVTDPETLHEFFRKTSPIAHVDAGDPPVLLFHGDDDPLVPIQQSVLLAARLKEANVPHKLIVAKGKGHGWEIPIENELAEELDWFSRYLLGNEN